LAGPGVSFRAALGKLVTMMERINPGEVADADAILDVRRHVGTEQIRGAVRYNPHQLLQAQRLTLPINIEGRVVLHTDNDSDAEEIGERLIAMGVKDVRVLHGGVEAWKTAGRRTEGATQEQPIPEVPSAGLPLL
jgi:rhodanese-related sulfurtransferase